MAPEHVREDHRKARKGKGRTGPVSRFDFHCDTFLWELQKKLAEKTYLPGKYVSFRILYPKPRLITAAPFRDRVVHHALCAVIAPLFESRFLPCSFANRPGFGTHRAFRAARRSCREYAYVLKCDVKRFFPSIDHEILKRLRILRQPDGRYASFRQPSEEGDSNRESHQPVFCEYLPERTGPLRRRGARVRSVHTVCR